jgi:hypothetical protein
MQPIFLCVEVEVLAVWGMNPSRVLQDSRAYFMLADALFILRL